MSTASSNEIPVKMVEDLYLKKIRRAPRIRFGEEFQKWDTAHQVTYLKALTSSLNHALDLMQQERNAGSVRVAELEEQLKNAESNLEVQKNITRQNLLDSNTETQVLSGDVMKLQAQVKKLEQELDG